MWVKGAICNNKATYHYLEQWRPILHDNLTLFVFCHCMTERQNSFVLFVLTAMPLLLIVNPAIKKLNFNLIFFRFEQQHAFYGRVEFVLQLLFQVMFTTFQPIERGCIYVRDVTPCPIGWEHDQCGGSANKKRCYLLRSLVDTLVDLSTPSAA